MKLEKPSTMCGDESGLGEDFTEDEKIGAFIVLACIVFAIGSVAWLIWG